MRCRLSTLLLLVTLIAILAAWITDRFHFKNRLVEEVDCAAAFASTMSRAACSNSIYRQIEDLDETEFAYRREALLITNVIFLFSNEHLAPLDKEFLVMRHAKVSLLLLGISDPQDFAERAHKFGYTDWCVEGFVNRTPHLTPQFADFLNRAIAYELPVSTEPELRSERE